MPLHFFADFAQIFYLSEFLFKETRPQFAQLRSGGNRSPSQQEHLAKLIWELGVWLRLAFQSPLRRDGVSSKTKSLWHGAARTRRERGTSCYWNMKADLLDAVVKEVTLMFCLVEG